MHHATAQEGIQVDQCKDACDVIKSARDEQVEKVSNNLTSQGYIVKNMWSLGDQELKKLWRDVRDILPPKIYMFAINYMNNTLRTFDNMFRCARATTDKCLACKIYSQSLLHVVSGCKVHLDEGRYTWRHDSILATLLSSIDGLRDVRIYADIQGYPCPTVVTGTLKRPDVIIVYQEKIVIILELTCGFVTNVEKNHTRKEQKYKATRIDLKKKYEKVRFVNLSMSALGLICKRVKGSGIFHELEGIGLSVLESKNIVRQIINVCIRSTHYIFEEKDKDWSNPELLKL